MIKKLAVFVEGQTEQIFVRKLLVEIAGQNRIVIDSVQARGPKPSRSVIVTGHSVSLNPFYALICDCGADNRVASDINDNHAGLLREGFSVILGLRDTYPEPIEKVPAMRTAIQRILPKGPIPVHLVLAIQEIEAWFIAEDKHFEHIHPELTCSHICSILGLDTTGVIAEEIAAPADTLHKIYQLKGRAYKKKKSHVERTVEALDYSRLYLELSARIHSLGELCSHIDQFVN